MIDIGEEMKDLKIDKEDEIERDGKMNKKRIDEEEIEKRMCEIMKINGRNENENGNEREENKGMKEVKKEKRGKGMG